MRMPLFTDRGLPLSPKIVLHVRPQISTELPPPVIVGIIFWEQSTIDICLFTKSGIILIVYVDNTILISPSKAKIQHEIKSLQGFFLLER